MKMAEYRDLANWDGEKAKGCIVQEESDVSYINDTYNDTYLILKTENNKVVGVRILGGCIDSYNLIGEADNLQEFINQVFFGSFPDRSAIWKMRVLRPNDVKGA